MFKNIPKNEAVLGYFWEFYGTILHKILHNFICEVFFYPALRVSQSNFKQV